MGRQTPTPCAFKGQCSADGSSVTLSIYPDATCSHSPQQISVPTMTCAADPETSTGASVRVVCPKSGSSSGGNNNNNNNNNSGPGGIVSRNGPIIVGILIGVIVLAGVGIGVFMYM